LLILIRAALTGCPYELFERKGGLGANNADNNNKGRFQHAPSPQTEIQQTHAITSHITFFLDAVCSRQAPIISGLSAYALAPWAQLAAIKGGLCGEIKA